MQAVGLEPTTPKLKVSCSTIGATPASKTMLLSPLTNLVYQSPLAIRSPSHASKLSISAFILRTLTKNGTASDGSCSANNLSICHLTRTIAAKSSLLNSTISGLTCHAPIELATDLEPVIWTGLTTRDVSLYVL